MKHIKLYPLGTIVCGALLLAASLQCEKMTVSEGDESPNVVLHIGSYEQTPFPARTRATAQEVCTRLNFIVYDEENTRIRQEEQMLGDKNFGTAQFALGDGNYYVVVIAHSSDGNPTSTDPYKIGFTNANGYTDTFVATDSLTVDGTEVEKSLNMERIVAKVRFVVEDDVPVGADGVSFSYTGGSGKFNAFDNCWGSVQSQQQKEYFVEGNEHEFEIYTIPRRDSDHLWLRVNAFKGESFKKGENLSDKVIDNIPIKRNYITTCMGYLYSPVYKLTYTMSINKDWAGNDTIQISK